MSNLNSPQAAKPAPIANHGEAEALKNLKAGDILHYDYRPRTVSGAAENGEAKLGDTFRVVQWNIERGVKLDAIISDLKALKADFVIVQELDINCRRSHYVNVPKELAVALQAELYFVCEFEELDSSRRSPENAVGPLSQPPLEAVTPEKLRGSHRGALRSPQSRHFHGNAILSRRVTLHEPTVVRHTTSVYWDEAGHGLREPRRGFRSALRVKVDAADRTPAVIAPLYIYCCHFEVFCGGLGRVRQLADCMADMQRLIRVSTTGKDACERQPAFLLGGDLNTMAHGIVRCSRRYGTDRLRWLSFGETEACWLQRKVLSRNMQFCEPGCCPFSLRFPRYAATRIWQSLCNNTFVWRYVYGFSRSEQDRTSNTKLYLYDPADKVNSITLDNPAYHGLVRGKLDWILLSNLQPRGFRCNRGGAEPFDIAALVKNGSIASSSYTARYLRSIQDGKQDNEEPEVLGRREEAVTKNVPSDGYLLFNQNYTASDHRGLVITVRQNSGHPKDVYPIYGAPYTTNFGALILFTLTRALPIGAIAFVLYRKWSALP